MVPFRELRIFYADVRELLDWYSFTSVRTNCLGAVGVAAVARVGVRAGHGGLLALGRTKGAKRRRRGASEAVVGRSKRGGRHDVGWSGLARGIKY